MNDIESQFYLAFARMDAKAKRGGARPNTGPKHGPGGKRAKLRICLTSDVAAYLTRDGETIGTAVETATRKSPAFRAWLKTRPNSD